MARQRRDYLRFTHAMVHSWANWLLSCETHSAIGYPQQTVEGRLMAGEAGGDSGRASSRVPDVMMPVHVAKVDRAMRIIPDDLRTVVEAHYLSGAKVSRGRLTEALQWLSGRLGGD